MPFNWTVIPALLGSYGLFWAGQRMANAAKSRGHVVVLCATGVLLAVPGLLIALYYLHFFDSWRLFYEFRSLRGSELTAAGVGLLGGMMAAWAKKMKGMRPVSTSGLLAIMTLGIALPHAKPVLASAEWDEFHSSWDGVVCRQSTGYSCGAACAATILRHHGIQAEEKEIALECFTYNGGTENWYIARALRDRGLRVRFHTGCIPDAIPLPCIAGIRLGKVGHFITILEDLSDSYRVGDPLVGDRIHRKESVAAGFQFTGFFMSVERERGH